MNSSHNNEAGHILIVDDNHDNADSLSILLEMQGNKVSVAYDGESALAKAQADRPEVILLDIGLANMSGHEVCMRIRREPWGASSVLIAISGWGHSSDLKESQDEGFDAHLVKPVAFTELVETIGRLRRNRPRQAQSVLHEE